MAKILLTFLAIFLISNSIANQVAMQSNNSGFHITIIGNKLDGRAKSLYDTAIIYAPKNAVIIWINTADKQHAQSSYPTLNQPAAFICIIQNKCSLPAFTPAKLQLLIQHFEAIAATVSSNNITPVSQPVTSMRTVANDENEITNLLVHGSNWLIVPTFWFIGLLLSFTPCLLPLMLIIGSIIGGNADTVSRAKSFALSLTYIISLAVTYAFAGIVFALCGVYLQAYMQNTWLLVAFSILFILLGLSLFGFFNLQLPLKYRKAISNYSKTHQSGSYIGVALMGVMATLIASPCVAPPLVGILAYIAQTGSVKLGALALFSVGIGIGTPVLIVNSIGVEILQKAGGYQKYIKKCFGILLLGIAIWILSRVIPANITMLLWAALVIFTSIYLGALDRKPQHREYDAKKALHRLTNSFNKMICVMLLLYGGALLIGALNGNTNPLSPLVNQQRIGPMIDSFVHVSTPSELQQALIDAKNKHKPVMLFFSAAWCSACNDIKKHVLQDAEIQALLPKFTLLYVDVSNINAEITKLTTQFNVIGPPAIFFYDAAGMRSHQRVDGDIRPDKLAAMLRAALP